MSQPTIRQWLTPAGFAAAVPELAAYPLPAISHALAMARSTAVPVHDAPPVDGGPAVYLLTPSHVLLVDAVRDDDPHEGRFVRLPAPLGGSAVGVPVPVVDTDTLLAGLRGGVADCYLFPPDAPTGHAAYHHRSAHQAIGALAGAAAMTRAVMAGDSNQDLTLILPALGHVLGTCPQSPTGSPRTAVTTPSRPRPGWPPSPRCWPTAPPWPAAPTTTSPPGCTSSGGSPTCG